MKRTDWLLSLAKNCDCFKFKIQKNLNRALSSSMRLSSNRSQARTNQNVRITWVIIKNSLFHRVKYKEDRILFGRFIT